MKKYKSICILSVMLIAALSFSGCKNNDITLTKEQNDLIAEYTAGILLKYSYQNQWDYAKLNTALNTYNGGVKPTSPSKNDSFVSQSTSSGNNNNNNVSTTKKTETAALDSNGNVNEQLADALGIDGASIDYVKYEIGNSYPTDSLTLSVPAESGCKIAAVVFTITNKKASPITVNTKESGVSMKLSVGGTNVSSYSSMLKGDILNLKNVTINANDSYTAFVLFQVKEELSTGVSGSTLSIAKQGKQLGTITIN